MSIEECSDPLATMRYRIEAAMFVARSRPTRPLSAAARHYDSAMHARYACDARNRPSTCTCDAAIGRSPNFSRWTSFIRLAIESMKSAM
jgi:hypothetical protein